MKNQRISAYAPTVLLACGSVLSAGALAQPADIEEITIIGTRIDRQSRGATNLQMSIFDTPQSVSVIDGAFIDNFDLEDVNDVLKLTTGVNVEEVETDRTYYNSRGFDIKSMQVDGQGLPFNWNVVGDLDTAIHDRVEVIRGANGLLTGTGSPSGTINYVRKRPTNDFQASIELTKGSWDRTRLEADVSTPLTESGSWAARFVVAALDTETHLRDNTKERQVFYGIIDGQISRDVTLALGFTRQEASSEGVMWGALPLIYANGVQTGYDPSASTTMDWTWWETETNSVFAEVQWQLAAWEWTTSLNANDYEEPAELFYTYSSPGLDQDTGLGLFGWPGKFFSTTEQAMLDSTLTRTLDLAGRSHEIVLGLNISDASNGYLDHNIPADDPSWGALPAFPGWTGQEIGRPDFGPGFVAADFDTDVRRFYMASNWSLSDSLNMILGANVIDAQSRGYSFGEPMNWSERETSPYIGFTYGITDSVNLYASYSDIYEPQGELTQDLVIIGPAVGKSYESGIKAELFDRGLLTSFSVFRAEQDNYAELAGFDTTNGVSYYTGTDVVSQGFELEASGNITTALALQAGYTQLKLEDSAGADARNFIPRRTFKAGARYTPVGMENLEVGANLRWQSDIHVGQAPMRINQDSYSVLSAYVNYAFTEALNVRLNANNLSDEAYLTSLYWDQSYYGAPRNYSLSVEYGF